MLSSQDTSVVEIMDFLDKCEAVGKGIETVLGPVFDTNGEMLPPSSTNHVAYEARQLKMLFLKLSAT